jgi:Phage P22-like portal protein
MADDILKDALDSFRVAEETEMDNRADALSDIRFARLSDQWPEAIRKQRELENRPCLTANKILPLIRQVVNDSRQNRPSMKVHPVDSAADPETAEIISGMIRNIEQSSDADVAYDTAVDSAVTMGWGYWKINLDYTMGSLSEDQLRGAGPEIFEQDICIRRVANPFSIFGDPYSQAADSSDWMQAHEVELHTHAQFKAKYKGAALTDFDSKQWIAAGAPWKSGENIQTAAYWVRSDITRQAVMVDLGGDEQGQPQKHVVMYLDDFEKQQPKIIGMGGHVVGRPRPIKAYKVKQHIVSGVEVLDSIDWVGSYIPIIPVYGDEVNLEGKRYFRSLVRDAKDPQRMFNYWRTATTEVVGLAPRVPFIGRKGAFNSDPRWATANVASHAFLEYDGADKPERQTFAGVPAGMLQEALNASDDIKAVTGIYDASIGARSNETSGKAILARQREGDVSTFHFIDNVTRAIRHTGRVIIDLLPRVISGERMARIIGEDGKAETVKINTDKTESQNDDEKDAMKIYDVRVGRYDVTVTSGPSFTTRREEAATQMVELIRAYPDAAPIIGDLLAKNMDWPGADEIAKRLERMLPPGARDEQGDIPPELQQQIKEMGQAIEELGQKLREAESKASIENRKVDVSEYQAETDRMQVLAPAMGPQDIKELVLQTMHELFSEELPEEVVPTAMEHGIDERM